MNARKISLIALLMVVLAAMAFPTLAAEKTVTVTLSESEINSSYRVTNPRNRTISAVNVDLQPGQVVITATYTTPKVNSIPVSVTLVPTLSSGRVTWTVSSATTNGKAASTDLLAQLNASISSSWRNYMKGKACKRSSAISR